MDPKNAQKNPAKKFALAAFLAAGVLLVFALFQDSFEHSDLLQTPGRPAPDFIFQDRNDRMFSSAELKGCVWVADFIFTHCAGTCPLLAKEMNALLKQWKDDPGFKLVSLTVDPERDTVEVLRKYASDFQVAESKWRFLTGKKEDLYRVIRDGFLESAGENSKPTKGYEFIHSSKMVLVDRGGLLRGTYDIEHDGDMKHLRKDIRYLLSKEIPPNEGWVNIHLPAPHLTVIAPKH